MLVCFAGECKCVQRGHEAAKIDDDPILSQSVYCEWKSDIFQLIKGVLLWAVTIHSKINIGICIIYIAAIEEHAYQRLFREFVSRKAAGKGRAVLEGLGHPPETIQACYVDNPLNEEAAVQAGLIKWTERDGDHCTWQVLLDAMRYAGIGAIHCKNLKDELRMRKGIVFC